MSQISPPIRILLVAVIGLCAAYMLFLRPKTDTAAPAATPAAATTPIPAEDPGAKTHSKPGAIVQKAVTDTRAASARSKVAAGEQPGGLASDDPSTTGAAPAAGVNTNPVTQAPATTQSAPAKLTQKQLATLPKDVRRAVTQRKVLALLFYNNRSDDDKATRRALAKVDRFGGQVFVDAHWIKNVAPYQAITRGVDLEQSPTVVVVDRNLKAESLVGYNDTAAIEQSVVDALLASGGSTIKDPYFRRLDAVCSSAKHEQKALSQPASAAAVPAYLSGVQAISVDADAKAAAVKPPHSHRAFARAFNRFNASTTAVTAKAAKDAKANPAKSVSIVRAAQGKEKLLSKRFVRKYGAHGLSCF
jgi:hypothetical protein